MIRGCSADFRSGTLVPGGMDWRSLGGLPGGLWICGDGIVMLFLSGPGEDWGTGGCTAVHTQEVVRRQRFPILVYDLSTDAIIGTDTLGSIYYHTPWT